MKITNGTIARSVLLVLSLANMILTATGHSPLPFDEAAIAETITYGAVIATSLAAAWKNNSFTKAAREADAWMRAARILTKHGAEAAQELSGAIVNEEEEVEDNE